MSGARQGRRAFLVTTAAVSSGVASVGRSRASGTNGPENACSRRDTGKNEDTQSIDSVDPTGSIDIDAINVTDSDMTGLTAFIVGGIHGDEKAGIVAAHDIADWKPDTGTIVVLPEANPAAIESNSRTSERGDLNRKFVFDQVPSTKLAQSIWQAVSAADPDVLISLQESHGIHNRSSSGVGQTVFSAPGDNTADAVSMGIRRANRTIGSKKLKFRTGRISGPNRAPNGLLSEKAAYEAGISSFIVETYENVNKKARVRWQKKIVSGILDYYDIYD